MEKAIPFFHEAKNTQKLIEYTKPYWNQELSELWKKLYKTEKNIFVKFNAELVNKKHEYNF